VGDIGFLVISAAENSNKFQKTRFLWKEKSVDVVVTLGQTAAPATLVSVMQHHSTMPSRHVKRHHKIFTFEFQQLSTMGTINFDI
jgi:hypothetical protein